MKIILDIPNELVLAVAIILEEMLLPNTPVAYSIRKDLALDVDAYVKASHIVESLPSVIKATTQFQAAPLNNL